MKNIEYTNLHKIFGVDIILCDIILRTQYLKQMEESFQLFKIDLATRLHSQPDSVKNLNPGLCPSSSLKKENFLNEMDFEHSFREGQFFELVGYMEAVLLKVGQLSVDYFRFPHSIQELNGSNNIEATKLFFHKSLLMEMDKLEEDFLFFENLILLRRLLTSRNRNFTNFNSSQDYGWIVEFSTNRFCVGKDNTNKTNITFTNPYFFFEILSVLQNFLIKIGEYDLAEEDPRTVADQLGYID